jgi:glutamate-1-semialdehyde 2,1-aminomutase
MPLKFKNKQCTGCHLCELVCSAYHFDEFAPTRARIRVSNHPLEGQSEVMACFSCPDAPCIAVCPQDAISRPGPRQPLSVDPEKCDGCGGAPACVPACPYGAMYFDAVTQYALACDLCSGDPQCVQFCYPGAVSFSNGKSLATKAGATAAKLPAEEKMKDSKSRTMWRRAAKVMPLGVSSNFRYWGDDETLVAEKAQGAYIWDVDGNRYIDYRLGFGPVILGHAYEEVDARIRDAIRNGVVYAFTSPLEISVAEKIVAMCPGVETVRLTNTGTETILHALRVARAYTGREKLIKFEGQYHGMLDYVLFSTYTDVKAYGSRRSPVPVPSTSGIPRSVHDLVITLPFNDFEVLETTLRRAWHDVAAIIVEPILGNCAAIEPLPGWLEFIRAKCNEYGIILIFDEVKTGFRLARGGAQEVYGVIPDLATYAKSLGNGYAVAAFGGRREVMSVVGVGVVCGGTYAGNVVGVAAADATLSLLQEQPILETIAERGRRLQAHLCRCRHSCAHYRPPEYVRLQRRRRKADRPTGLGKKRSPVL